MNSIVRTERVPLNKLSHAIENWEERLRQHNDSGKQAINEDLLVDALIGLCPEALAQHINLDLDNLVHPEGTP